MSDIVEQLRDIQHRFIFQGNSKFALSIASEIERLRARVEVLERALHAAKDAMAAVSVPRDNERAILFQAYDAALVALEDKP
jgi:hypothetical protein